MFAALVLLSAWAMPTVAMDHHAMKDMAPLAHDTPSTAALKQANMAMHKGMDIKYSNDADRDFLRGMIAHHQGAVEMARVELKYGNDLRARRLANEIIRAQELEIKWMGWWLEELDRKAAGDPR
ncbi:MAG: DUF305 domain-containing protein [Proteobacteria bacterium]|nr:DUF305 domain-containing protein [Pseudomonadota bacterium]